MKKTIFALSVVFAAVGFTSQAHGRIAQVTSEVICHECACGREHYIETQRKVERPTPAKCMQAKRDAHLEAVATTAGAVLGVAAATVAIVCLLAIAPQATLFFGFVWFVSTIFCVS
ncbi:MAG: hypothetical protein AB7F19_03380 [Candidatus Babeliales bacterium]